MKRHWIYILTVPVMAVLMLVNYGTAFSDDKHDDKPDDKHPPFTKIDKQINQQAAANAGGRTAYFSFRYLRR